MASGPLSPPQRVHFAAFGFLVLPGYLHPAELAALAAEHERALDAAFRAAPFDGTGRHSVQMLSDATPAHAALPEDRRFCGAAEQLYGEDAFFSGVDANRYVGASDWHPDHATDPLEDCHGAPPVTHQHLLCTRRERIASLPAPRCS